jgi:hypothetical protein
MKQSPFHRRAIIDVLRQQARAEVAEVLRQHRTQFGVRPGSPRAVAEHRPARVPQT